MGLQQSMEDLVEEASYGRPEDLRLPAGAAALLLVREIPGLLNAVLVKEDAKALKAVASRIVRLLGVASANIKPGSKFSQSPEYKEAIEKYRSRISTETGQSQTAEVKELVAR